MFDWSFPVVSGWDVAEIIEQVGSAVKDFRVGDVMFPVSTSARTGGVAGTGRQERQARAQTQKTDLSKGCGDTVDQFDRPIGDAGLRQDPA